MQARSEKDGALDDEALSAIIARAIATTLTWHLEAPEHTRNATLSSRSWRPAGGPRGAGGRFEEPDDRPPRQPFEPRPPRGPYPPRRAYPQRPPFEQRGPYQSRGRFDTRGEPPFDSRDDAYEPRGPRDFDDSGPPEYEDRRRPSPRGGGGGGGYNKRGGGFSKPKRGGFGPRRPPRPR
jgi:hypothetical protein